MGPIDGKGGFTVSALPDDLERSGAIAATSKLQQRAAEIRSNRVSWQSYLQSQMISEQDYNVITQFESATPERREAILQEHSHQVVSTLFNLIYHISRDQTVQYLLTLIDDTLQENKSRVEIFREYARRQKETVWSPWLNLLARPDAFIVNQASTIIAKLACWSTHGELMSGSDLSYFLRWIKDQLQLQGNEYIQTSGRVLQMMMRIEEYRFEFANVDGIACIVTVLSSRILNFQIQYQLVFCLWCLTFNPPLAERIIRLNVIPTLADVLAESGKEKVTRIILATFKNLLEKPEDDDIVKEAALGMVQCKVLKQLSLLENNKYKDEDLIADIDFLTEKLTASVHDLSSFDEYSTELKSGRLEWSPVHKSEKFWRENATRLNEKNYELLKILVKLLESSKDSEVVCVAAHDVGEYVRHYPRGKTIIEQLGGKQLVMQYLTHEDPNVRYEALLSVQKLMVHNWEYLGKQLEKPEAAGSAK